jgi:hypothetical protein
MIKDDGRCAWLYLTEPAPSDKVLAGECWLFNRVPAPDFVEQDRDIALVVPNTYASEAAMMEPPT